jgi:hypothetical protein
MKILSLLLMLLVIPLAAVGQIKLNTETAISASDPIYPVLEARKAEIQKQYKATDYALARFSSWVRIDSPATTKLFPKLRFASIVWSEYLNPSVKPLPAHDLGMGMELTVAVDTEQMKIVADLSNTGNQQEFGKLLTLGKVRIADKSDAEVVWNAFCTLTHLHWENYPIDKLTETEWHLGNSYDDGLHYYYEVLLDENHFVRSGALKTGEIKKP